jgi:hypothetical protein
MPQKIKFSSLASKIFLPAKLSTLISAATALLQSLQTKQDSDGPGSIPPITNDLLKEWRSHRWEREFDHDFELYLTGIKDTSQRNLPVFECFRKLLVSLYMHAEQASDEVAAIFDRALAAEADLASMQEAVAALSLRTIVKAHPKTAVVVEGLRVQANAAAGAAMLRKAMGPVRRERDPDLRTQLAALKADIAARARAISVYRAREALIKGRWLGEDGQRALPKIKIKLKLSRAILTERYGAEVVKRLPRGISSAKNGLEPDIVAGWFGYGSGDEMLLDLVQAPPLADTIAAMTEAAIAARFGDVLTDGRAREAALAAFHCPERGTLLASEMAALTGDGSLEAAPLLLASAEASAEGMMAEMTLRDAMDIERYFAAEKKADAQARQALAAPHEEGKADDSDLADALWQRLLNHCLCARSAALRKQLDETQRAMRQHLAEPRSGSLSDEAAAALDELVTRHALLEEGTERRGRPFALLAFNAALVARGQRNVPALPQSVLRDLKARRFDELTVPHFRDLAGALASIAHVGALPERLVDADGSGELEPVVDEILAALAAHPAASATGEAASLSPADAAMTVLAGIDGGKDGPAHRHIGRPITRALAARDAAWDKVRNALEQLWALYAVEEQQAMDVPVSVPEAGRSLSKWQMIALATSVSQPESLAHLSDVGRPGGMGPEALNATLARLDARDWAFVHGLWQLMAAFWPQIEARETRATGVTPQPTRAHPVATPFGLSSGGFFPLQPARPLSALVEPQGEDTSPVEAGLFARAQTRDGLALAASLGQAPCFDLAAVQAHLFGLVHDLALSEALVNARRILRHGDVEHGFAAAGREAELIALQRWLDDLAAGPQLATALPLTLAPYLGAGGTAAGLVRALAGSLQPEITAGNTEPQARGTAIMLRQGISGVAVTAADVEAQSLVMARRRTACRLGASETGTAGLASWLARRVGYLTRDLPLWLATWHDAKARGTDVEATKTADARVAAQPVGPPASGEVTALLTALALYAQGRMPAGNPEEALAWAADMGVLTVLARRAAAGLGPEVFIPGLTTAAQPSPLPPAMHAVADESLPDRETLEAWADRDLPLIGLPPDSFDALTTAAFREAGVADPSPLAVLMAARAG